MRRVHVAGTALLTSDETAEALLDYARALASAGDADHCRIPVAHRTGDVQWADLLVGPGIPLVVEPAPDILEAGASDAAIIADLRARTERARRVHRAGWPEPPGDELDVDGW